MHLHQRGFFNGTEDIGIQGTDKLSLENLIRVSCISPGAAQAVLRCTVAFVIDICYNSFIM